MADDPWSVVMTDACDNARWNGPHRLLISASMARWTGLCWAQKATLTPNRERSSPSSDYTQWIRSDRMVEWKGARWTPQIQLDELLRTAGVVCAWRIEAIVTQRMITSSDMGRTWTHDGWLEIWWKSPRISGKGSAAHNPVHRGYIVPTSIYIVATVLYTS